MAKPHKKTTDPPLIKRNRDGDTHIQACGTGYMFGEPANWSTYSNIHHIVCVTCMTDANIEDQVDGDDRFEFIKNCLAETDWNINDEPNTVGLPKKQAFVDSRADPDWGGWACHQVDHSPKYIEKVKLRLKDEVWDKVQSVAADCKVEGEKIAKRLEGESKFWRRKLSKRKTAKAWEAKYDDDEWYVEFSMDIDDPTPRKPPPNWADKFKPGMVSRLSELFEMI